MIDESSAEQVIADGKDGLSNDAGDRIASIRAGGGSGDFIETAGTEAIAEDEDGDGAVGNEFLAGGVEGFGGDPGSGHLFGGFDAAGEEEVVDDFIAFAIDVFIDEMGEEAAAAGEVDGDVLGGGGGEDGFILPALIGGVEAEVVALGKGIEGFGPGLNGGLAVEEEGRHGSTAVLLIAGEGAEGSVSRGGGEGLGHLPAGGQEGSFNSFGGAGEQEVGEVGFLSAARGLGAIGDAFEES